LPHEFIIPLEGLGIIGFLGIAGLPGFIGFAGFAGVSFFIMLYLYNIIYIYSQESSKWLLKWFHLV
jgi:hypothetical protein